MLLYFLYAPFYFMFSLIRYGYYKAFTFIILSVWLMAVWYNSNKSVNYQLLYNQRYELADQVLSGKQDLENGIFKKIKKENIDSDCYLDIYLWVVASMYDRKINRHEASMLIGKRDLSSLLIKDEIIKMDALYPENVLSLITKNGKLYVIGNPYIPVTYDQSLNEYMDETSQSLQYKELAHYIAKPISLQSYYNETNKKVSVIVGFENGTIALWKRLLNHRDMSYSWKKTVFYINGYSSGITHCYLIENGLYAAVHKDGDIVFGSIDIEEKTMKQLHTVHWPYMIQNVNHLTCISIVPLYDQSFYIALYNNSLKEIELYKGSKKKLEHVVSISCLEEIPFSAFDKEGRFFSWYSKEDKDIKVWNIEKKSEIVSSVGTADRMNSEPVAVSLFRNQVYCAYKNNSIDNWFSEFDLASTFVQKASSVLNELSTGYDQKEMVTLLGNMIKSSSSICNSYKNLYDLQMFARKNRVTDSMDDLLEFMKGYPERQKKLQNLSDLISEQLNEKCEILL